MSEYLPLEIQAEILKRLPLKPLIQFRSVSKPWKSLIDSANFIASYGFRRPHPDRFILRYVEPGYPDEYKYITLVDNDHSLVQQDLIPTAPEFIKRVYTGVVGSSHGLLCFNGYCQYLDGKKYKMVVLWNPAIRKYIGIQVPYMDDLPINNNFIGFGVCPTTFDPTILKIGFTDYEQNLKDMSVPWKVQVFTLSTGTWSILSTNLPRESVRLRRSQVVIGRYMYWVGYDMLGDEVDRFQSHYLIVSFDLTDKKFKEMNLTGSLTNQLCSVEAIANLRESLVLLEYHREFEGDISVCCLWMMKEEGDSRSFTKLYTINLPNAQINHLLGFKKSGELILETREELEQYGEVQIYKHNNGQGDYIGIDGEPNLFFMCSYMETLLLIDQSDGYTYSNSMELIAHG